MKIITIQPSTRKDKKLMATDGKRSIHFGQRGASDYTRNKDPERKQRYIDRHSGEDWSQSNAFSPAFMSRYVLWEEPSLEEAVKALDRRLKGVKVVLKKT